MSEMELPRTEESLEAQRVAAALVREMRMASDARERVTPELIRKIQGGIENTLFKFLRSRPCWFIERKANPESGRWLAGFRYDEPLWTNESLRAIRFVREQDAAALCKDFGLFGGIGEAAQRPFASEHVFMEGV